MQMYRVEPSRVPLASGQRLYVSLPFSNFSVHTEGDGWGFFSSHAYQEYNSMYSQQTTLNMSIETLLCKWTFLLRSLVIFNTDP